MGQVTHGARAVMHMRAAERMGVSADAGPRDVSPRNEVSRTELVGRDKAGRFVRSSVNGADGMSRMKIGLSPQQKRWVDDEAARRGVPKTVVVRELLDRVLTSGARGSFDADPSVRDVGADGSVHDIVHDDVAHDVVGLEDGDPRRVQAGAGADPDAGEPRARVPEVEVVDSSGRVAGFDPRNDDHGRRDHHGDFRYPGESARRGGVPDYVGSPGVIEQRVAVDSVRAAVGNPSAGDGSEHMSHVPAGVGVSRRRDAGVPAEAGGPLEGLPPGVTLPGGMHAQVVSEGADSKSLVVSGGAVSSESGVIVMMPGAGPGGTMGPVRIPLASYVKGQHVPLGAGGGFFSGLPGFVKYGMVAFSVLVVLLGFLYLGSSFVANRYEFREVEIAPGRVIFYRVDKWTGEMERCQSGLPGYRESGPVC